MLPDHPRTDDQQAWEIWATRVYGVIRDWIIKDEKDDACHADLRAKGRIR